MGISFKAAWSKPSTILLASDIPVDETAFAFALAQSAQFDSALVIFHAIEGKSEVSLGVSGKQDDARASYTQAKERYLETLAQRAIGFGVRCKVVVRIGLASDQILSFLREGRVDRVVMGNRSPGPIGKLLVGSVAEAVIRQANVPVCIVGSDVVASSYRNSATRNILCDVSIEDGRRVVASFGAERAAEHHANLILQDTIRPQEKDSILAGRTIDQIEAELPSLVPAGLQDDINVRTKVALGDPTEELLYGCRSQNASFIVLGAQGASHFAAITCASMMYKVLAFANCPVITLSPVVLAECGAGDHLPRITDVNYLAGVV